MAVHVRQEACLTWESFGHAVHGMTAKLGVDCLHKQLYQLKCILGWSQMEVNDYLIDKFD